MKLKTRNIMGLDNKDPQQVTDRSGPLNNYSVGHFGPFNRSLK